MKKILTLCSLSVLLLSPVQADAVTNKTGVVLSWDYSPQVDTNLSFTIRSSTTLNTNSATWPALLTLPTTSTNLTSVISNGVATFSASVPVAPGEHFFVVTAKNNMWGESEPSNVATTPGVALVPTRLRVVVTVEITP